MAGCAVLVPIGRAGVAQEASVTGAQFRASGKTARVTTTLLRGGVNAVLGSGGNMLALPGGDGKVVVDSGLATSQEQVSKALAELSAQPLRHLLNTHWHFDHTDGNLWMHEAGAEIVAQENTRIRMSSRQVIPAFSIVLPPSPAAALPTVVFKETTELFLNGETIRLKRYTPAHTDSDTSVFFTKANVLHTGDTWFNGFYPFIDYDSGGNIDGMITAATETLALTDAETIIVPGHGEVGRRADLAVYHDMLVECRSRVAELKKKGLSLEATIQAKPTAAFDEKLGGAFVGPALFVALIYRGV